MHRRIEFSYLSLANEKQRSFHATPKPFKCFVGGYGSGKSTALIHDVWMNCYQRPGTNALIARKTYRELEDTTWRDAQAIIPREVVKKWRKEEMTCELVNNVLIYFRSCEDPEKLKLNLGMFAIDEAQEVGREYWEMLMARLRHQAGPGKGILACNYAGHNWIWKIFKMGDMPLFDESCFLVESSTFDNAHNLPKAYLTTLKMLPRDTYKRNVEGSWDSFEGQVFTEFQERAHVCAFDLSPYWTYKIAVDPGLDHPTAAVWYGVDHEGRVYVFDEYCLSELSATSNARNLLMKTAGWRSGGDHGGPIKIRLHVIDPSSLKQEPTSMKSVFMEYMQEGIRPLIPAVKDARRLGMLRVQEYLQLRSNVTHPVLGVKPGPRVVIHPRCRKLIAEIMSFTWAQFAKKTDDDLIDALKYALCMEAHPSAEKMDIVQPEVPTDPRTGSIRMDP